MCKIWIYFALRFIGGSIVSMSIDVPSKKELLQFVSNVVYNDSDVSSVDANLPSAASVGKRGGA